MLFKKELSMGSIDRSPKRRRGKGFADSYKNSCYTNLFNRLSPLFHIFLACFVCFFIEAFSRHSILEALRYMHMHTLAFLYNALIIFTTLLAVYLFRRRTLMRVLICSIWAFLGIVNGCLLLQRVTPFGYTDLKLINDLFTMKSNYFSDTQAVLAIGGVVLFIAFCIVLWKKGPKYKGNPHRIIHLLILVSSCFWLPAITKAAVNNDILSDYFTNIAKGYENYGFVYGFSTSVVGRGMKKSIEYSRETITAIENRVNTKKKETMFHAGDQELPNLIIVLLESFIYPDEIKFLKCSKDPVPTFTNLVENYTTGYLKVPVVGAGTANTEFEILTGMNMKFFGTGEYPYKTILQNNPCESIADVLKQNLGYGSHVVHNNGGNFYSRANAFSKMGFDTFTSKECLNITKFTPLGTWATDDILLPAIQKAMDSTAGPDCVYAITVQGHGAYPTKQVLETPEIKVSGCGSEHADYQWEYYINMLHEMDQFIANLISDVEARDENTMIVLFGDHLPSLEIAADDTKCGSIYKTRYATWNNFGLKKEDKNTTSYRLVADILDNIGIHEGTMFAYHQTSTDSKHYIKNMELLQYDILYGKKYAYGEEERYPASDIVMGIDEVTIKDTLITDNHITIIGQNFTPWTKIYVNNNRVSTQYANASRLTVSRKYVNKGDLIIAKILGSGSSVFRESNEFLVQ